jgi:hypothetical protein
MYKPFLDIMLWILVQVLTCKLLWQSPGQLYNTNMTKAETNAGFRPAQYKISMQVDPIQARVRSLSTITIQDRSPLGGDMYSISTNNGKYNTVSVCRSLIGTYSGFTECP